MSGGSVIPCPACPDEHYCYLEDYAPSHVEGVYRPNGAACGRVFHVRFEVLGDPGGELK